MAYFFRLVAALLLLGALPAHALIPKVDGYRMSVTNWPSPTLTYPTALAACQYWADNISANRPIVVVGIEGTSPMYCRTYKNTSTNWSLTEVVKAVGSACPVNSAASGASCACSAGFVEDPTKTSCVAQASQLEQFCKDAVSYKNSFAQTGTISSTSSLPAASCYKPDPPFPGADATKGCAMKLGDGITVPREGNALLRDWSATGVPTGGTCEDAAATDTAPKSSPNPCPDGFAGTLNGATVCIKREPDKGIEGVKGTEVKNADGTSTITKETTKCEGGQCTTTKETTTKDASGAQVGAVKVEETKQGIGGKCAADPGNKVCSATGLGDGEGGGGLTGSCAAGFEVKGEDPILNAMALEQYKRNCKFFENDTDSQSTVNKIRNGSDTQNADAMKAAATAAPVTIQTFDSAGRGWGRSCPANPVIPLVFVNKNFEIPFSRICLPLQAFAAAGVALTMLGSFVWVMGGKK